jgi:hypothetical protein
MTSIGKPDTKKLEIGMEIPLNAQGECSDGVFGRSAFVLINPGIDQVTHLVVKEDSSPNTEYIVPIGLLLGNLLKHARKPSGQP